MGKPQFFSHKVSISPLELKIYDYQLRDHLMIDSNIYIANCNCNHKHNNRPCSFRNTLYCDINKCSSKNKPNKIFLEYKYLLFHKVGLGFNLSRCDSCSHTHKPNCESCINCKTGKPCIIDTPFECNLTENEICCNKFTTPLQEASNLSKHFYNIKPNQPFFICKKCKHYHNNDEKLNKTRECWIQSKQCCEHAMKLIDYPDSFFIYHKIFKSTHNKYVFISKLIYTPKIWQQLSLFVSLLTAIVYNFDPKVIKTRFEKFNVAPTKIPSLKIYKSGGDSIIRSNITGFPTKGAYQTSVISCVLEHNKVLVPKPIYNAAKKSNFFLDLCVVKRDPSFHPTSLYVLWLWVTPEPCIGISESISKPLNQDQDGDKNVIYFLEQFTADGFNKITSFLMKLVRMELSLAYKVRITLICRPRLCFSERNLLNMYRNQENFMQNPFFKRTYKYGPKFMIEAGCTYLKDEYDEFSKFLIDFNKNSSINVITLSDIFQKTSKLKDIVDSGVKPNTRTLQHLKERLFDSTNLLEKKNTNIVQVNEYLNSSKTLRDTGHNQFICLYSNQDMTIHLGNVHLNKKFLADYKTNSCFFTHMSNQAALKLFMLDLIEGE